MEWSLEIIKELISDLGYPIVISLILVFYLGKKIDKTNDLIGNHLLHLMYRILGEEMPEDEKMK